MEPTQIRIGNPVDWKDFEMRHPKFIQNLKALYEIIHKIFIREMKSAELADRVIFYLGRLAIEDFNEILLLCGNGYGIGAMKILRGLYERTVTLAYISQNPDKSMDFLDYFHIIQWKFFNHAKNSFSLDQLNLSEEEAKAIQLNYDKVKEKYKRGNKIRNSWSELDIVSMSRNVGLDKLYLPCFFHPTMQIHSTVTSLFSRLKLKDDSGLTFIDGPQNKEADYTLNVAHNLILFVLDTVNDYFKMGQNKEIEKHFKEFQLIWQVKESNNIA